MNRSILGAVLLACACAGAGPAVAQTTDKWTYGAALYGWFPSIGGKTTFPAREGGSSVTVDADTILSDLEFVFMGSFEARKGRWGVFTDFIYMDLGDSKSGSRQLSIGGQPLPADVEASAKYDIEGTAWTLAAMYNVASTPDHDVNLLGGFRYLDLDQKLNYSLTGNVSGIPVVDRSGERKLDTAHWDAIVGAKGRFYFGAEKQWFVPWYADVGTGESDLTYQLMGGLGYRFKWGDLLVSYRYLDYDLGEKVPDLYFSGPMVGVVFRW